MLFAVAISGAMLAAGSVVWHQEAQRARERELLNIGEEFRRAVGAFYERGSRYPEKLDDLLLDRRSLTTRRYLRRVYRDPMTGGTEWGLVPAPGGGIMGVYSLSDATPIKAAGFDKAHADFVKARSYADWKFVYVPTPIFPLPSSAHDVSVPATPQSGR